MSWPSASNGSAAVARCSGVSVFWVPNHVYFTRQAAIVWRSRCAGVVVLVVVGRISVVSIRAVIVAP
jgi:hypothetical protein